MASRAEPLIDISRRLADAVDTLAFGPPVHCVYNPLRYAAEPHELYLRRYGRGPKEALFIGMNPGPFGMAQTGVPFGDVASVRDWMGIEGPVGHPPVEHVKRPIAGFGCRRAEVSGTRLWSWAAARFGTASAFFERFFVHNYCPLAFLDEGGRNLTPDKLPRAERDALEAVCDRALAATIAALEPAWVIGIGDFATKKALGVAGPDARVATILHPSPASPRANRGWAEQAEAELSAIGIALPSTARRT